MAAVALNVTVTATLTCQRCLASLPVSWPVRITIGGGIDFSPIARLSGSEQVLLALFAESHQGPFVAETEAR